MIIRQNVESAGSLRVLHVDDDASILEVSKNILTLEGKFEIDFACCADEAFEKLQEQKYDVIVSDYEMPGKNGLDFLKELKDKQISIPFILFTGKGREEVAVKALNLGADGYYNKQGNPETVYGELVHGITMAVAANKTKLALNESQEKFQKVFDSSTVGIAVFNMHKDKIVDCNKSFEQLSGYSKQEIIENQILTLKDMRDPDNRKLLFSELLKVGHTEKKQLEMVTRSGEIKLVDASFSTVEIDGAPHSICNVTDVTKSRATEEALKEMQVLMNSTINSTEDMIWSVSAEDFTLLTFNKATSDYFLRTQNLQIKAGMSSEEIMPTKDLAERWIQLNKRALREGTFSIEYRTLIEPRILEMVFNVMKQGERTFGIAVFARDITERKKAEEALLESEDKYRELVSRLPEMVFEIDTQGKVVFVNKRAYELTGYSEDELAKGFNSLFLVAPEDRERSKENLKKMFDRNLRQSNEYAFVRKDGSRFPVQLTSAPIIKDGKVLGARGIALDISERKKAELEFEQKYYALDKVAENIGAGLAIIDKSYRVVWSNSLLRKVGYIPNKKCYEVSGSIAICTDCGVRKVFEQSVPIDIHEYKHVSSKGKVSWFEIRATSLKDKNGNVSAAIELVVPISERKKAEAKLGESEEKFRSLADESPNMIFINQKGKVVYANKKCEEIMGYKRKEFYASDFDFMSIVAQESIETLNSAFARHQTEQQVPPYEYRLITKDGRRIDAEISTKLICYEGEKAILGVVTDITERKKAEETLETAYEKLRVVGGLTRHDVKNKLMAANTNLYLLRKKTSNQPELAKYIEGIETAIKQSDRLFEFSRLYEQIGAEKPMEVDVAECFSHAANLVATSGLKVINECQGLKVTADPMLRQLFYNLIDNSLKHGKIVTEIRVHYLKDQTATKLFYEDNGVGITEESKKKIFAEGYTTGNGSGLGLKLVKKMIEVYGWTIEEVGTPGKGVIFQIKIPPEKTLDTPENICILPNFEDNFVAKPEYDQKN